MPPERRAEIAREAAIARWGAKLPRATHKGNFEGVGIRTAARLTGVNRGTVGSLALRVGLGCMELHDRIMVGVRTERLELDEAWSFVAKKQKNVLRHEIHAKGDQYIFIGMAGTQKAIISWGVGKRNAESTMDFLHDLRSRVIGQPEISTDGFHPYRVAIRDAFGDNASHGVIVKTSSVTHLVKEAQGRYSPAAVVAVSREVVTGDPDQYVSTRLGRALINPRLATVSALPPKADISRGDRHVR